MAKYHLTDEEVDQLVDFVKQKAVHGVVNSTPCLMAEDQVNAQAIHQFYNRHMDWANKRFKDSAKEALPKSVLEIPV